LLAGPLRIGLRVRVGNVRDRVPLPTADRAGRPVWVAPVGTRHPPPPDAVVIQRYGPLSALEHERSWHEQLRVGLRIVGPARGVLGGGDMSRRLHEPAELA